MICYNCDNKVPIKSNQCDYCGEDLKMLQKAHRLSNSYYNIALSKAKVRDLSGAIFLLKKSLSLNKANINARNLLGLIYFEMGETVAALSEWIISKHYNPNNNESKYYIQSIQENPTKLDTLNQTIKKYNGALNYANQGDDDLAVIQLRKVIHLNPRFVKALQLLSLIYINSNELSKAHKFLKRAQEIDVSNITTLRYLKEIEGEVTETTKNTRRTERKTDTGPSQVFTASPYKEDKPNIWVFISLIAGIIIGVVACVILIMPTVRNNIVNEFRDSEVQYNAKISQKEQEIASALKSNKDLKDDVDKLNSDIEKIRKEKKEVVERIDNSSNEKLLGAVALYIDGISAGNLDYIAIADLLSEVDLDKIENSDNSEVSDAVNIYHTIKDGVYVEASRLLYREGYNVYSDKKYDQALEILSKAYKYNPSNVDAIYFLGRTYQRIEDIDKAREYYTILVDEYPATKRGTDARDRLRRLG